MMNCLAIDDELLALELLEDNIKKVPFLNLVGKCRSAAEAMTIMNQTQIDLLLLDIEMPDINGLQMIKGLTHKPIVIFITAYDKYAMLGYDLDVLDYLLKPVSFERFLKAANKALEFHNFRYSKATPPQSTKNNDVIFVRSEHRIVKINISDIQYIESLKDYVKIYVSHKAILSLMSLKYLEDTLPEDQFIRVHRSYIVSVSKINYISRSKVIIGTTAIPISNFYRDNLTKLISPDSLPKD